MKVLIVSDSHGKCTHLERALQQEAPIDLLLHCGDVCGDEDYIRSLAGCPAHFVRGNNDFFCDLDREKKFSVGRHSVWLVHGNRHNVNSGTEVLRQQAFTDGIEIVCYGHTHVPNIANKDGVWLINPGSIAAPRQAGRKPTYIVMELDRMGDVKFTLHEMSEKG